jgi:restriction system protein
MTVRDAAQKVLDEAEEPLHVSAITERIQAQGYWASEGQTPGATVGASLAVSVKRGGTDSPFQRVAPATYGLRAWGLDEEEPEPELPGEEGQRVRVPLLRPYAETRHLMRVLDGTPKAQLQTMFSAIREQTGTPQNPVNWSDPDSWIDERLTGGAAELARAIYEASDHTLNPRYARGSYFLIETYGLLKTDEDGTYHITPWGNAFLDEDPGFIHALDEAEGMGELLSILATKTRAMRGDLLPEWKEFLNEYSSFGSRTTIKDTLRRRLVNLIDREYVERDGNTYVITPAGEEYAATFAQDEGGDPRQEVQQALTEYNNTQREQLRDRLAEMDPYLFEHLVRDLLEAMGYQDVEVTQQSGDKGVDFVATVQFGITEVKEVVQVKRTRDTIGRPKLDQLRGALPYHEAIRGTIITLGRFSKNCTERALFTGAAPVTLIDGERLLDLLIEHEIGMQKKPTVLYEVDARYFEDGD